MARILLVEDDRDIAAGLEYSLAAEGHEVCHAETVAAARAALAGGGHGAPHTGPARQDAGHSQVQPGPGQPQAGFGLLLLDITLPDGSGYDVLRESRAAGGGTPVIFLTARDDETNIVMGLDMGADDYITKPFRVRELISRINSVLRRTGQQAVGEIVLGSLVVRPTRAQVLLAGQELPLTAVEYRLLLCFVNRPGQIFSRGQLLESIWDAGGEYVNDNTLSVYIKRLRAKLTGSGVEIETVRGLGYRLEVRSGT